MRIGIYYKYSKISKKYMQIKIKQHKISRGVQGIKIKDRTKNKYGVPTFLAMERMLNK